jgi:hypothetical protein
MGAVSVTCSKCSTANVFFPPDNIYVIINFDNPAGGAEAKYICKKCQQEHTIYWTKVEKIKIN